MKFVQIVDDVNADRGIFVTTSDFVAAAVMTAAQYDNIELWNRDKITSLVGALQLRSSPTSANLVQSDSVAVARGPENRQTKRVVLPAISYQQIQLYASERVKKKGKGGFLGAGKVIEDVKDAKLVLYPYFDLGMKVTIHQVEKTGLLKSEDVKKIVPCRISVDAVTGGIVQPTTSGISYQYALPQITPEEASILRTFRHGFNMKTILGAGLGEAKTKRLVNGLLTRGILHASPTKPVLYTPTTPYPQDPTVLSSLSQFHQVSESAVEGNTKTVSPKIDPALVSNMIESYLYAKVEDIDLVYYPYYEIWFERPDGSNRVEVLDGMTGALSEKIVT